jgi:hypothetical protein
MAVVVLVELGEETVRHLKELVGPYPAIAEDLESLTFHLLESAATGVRRPGSWERGWLTQATGWDGGYFR